MGLFDLLRLPKRRNRLAFAFYATNDEYAVAVLVFVHLLQQLGIRKDADVVVLHLPLAPDLLGMMKRMGIRSKPPSNGQSPTARQAP